MKLSTISVAFDAQLFLGSAGLGRSVAKFPAKQLIFSQGNPGKHVMYLQEGIDQLFNSSEKRLARTLLFLARYGEPGYPQKVLPKVSQEMLAEMVGTTRTRVNSFMNKFRKLGFIEYGRRLEGLHIDRSLLQVVLHD